MLAPTHPRCRNISISHIEGLQGHLITVMPQHQGGKLNLEQ